MKSENEKLSGGLANLANLANSTLERAKQAPSPADKAITEHLAERAAIMEYDGELDRDVAEAEARRELRIYEYRLTDNPSAWLVMITPGCNLEQAITTCNNKFGSDRIIEVREYKHGIKK